MTSWSGISSLPLSIASRALRRHLDGVSVEASIGDIVDSCRIWESHTEAGYGGPDLKFPHTISQVAEGAQPQLGSIASDTLQESTGLVMHCHPRG